MSTSQSTSLPLTMQELPVYLDKFLPEEAQGKTKIIPLFRNPNQYMILCKFTLTPTTENEKFLMEKVARDFIFASYEAAYTSNIDIVSSTIFIKCANGKPGLTIGIGKQVADQFDHTYWADRSTSPNEFMTWLKTHKHNAPNAFKKCSYNGIYAKEQ